jgi:CheY-like chemotaxis protein
MEHDILIADSDGAFASVLAEQLEALGRYRVTIVKDGNTLLERTITGSCDLLIVDVTLQDPALPELLNRVRALRPSLRLVVIPYPGNKVPFTLKDIPGHGLLPKPFMTEELPRLIRRALEAESAVPLGQMADLYDPRTDGSADSDFLTLLSEDESVSIASAPGSDHPTRPPAEDVARWDIGKAQSEPGSEGITIPPEGAVPILRALERELQAALVVLSCKTHPLAHTGTLPRARVEDFCRFVARRIESGAQIMRFLGADDENIATLLDEGQRYRVYTTQVTPAMWLTVVLEFHVPVGSLRYHIRKAVEQLAGLTQ